MTTAGTPSSQTMTLAVTATFTAEPLDGALTFWMDQLGIPAAVHFAPYNQVFQQLLDPSSLIASNNKDSVNVVLLRPEDWAQDAGTPAAQEIERNARDFIGALKTAVGRASTSYVIALCPPSEGASADPARRALLNHAEDFIRERSGALSGVYVLDTAGLGDRYRVSEIHDPYADKVGHIPYTPAYFAALGTAIARTIHALRHAPYKVIAVDCDGTLWGGVCGEDSPDGIDVEGPYHALQRFLVEQHDNGMLLCLCTKNNENDVLEVFRRRPEMPLRLDHFVARRINWQPKSDNLAAMAGELDLGLDSFIFLDDNPIECAEVCARRPEVLALALPAAPADVPDYLAHLWAFDHLKVTDEDRRRTLLYAQNRQRESVRAAAPTIEDFLAGLRIDVSFAPAQPAQVARVADLTQRTNQFNAMTIRRSEGEIAHLLATRGADCWTVEVRDRFGDYGLVGVVIFTADADALRVDTFLLSCRALGRRVEDTVLARLARVAAERGRRSILFPYQPTPKNTPIREFLRRLGADPVEGDDLPVDADVYTVPFAVDALLSRGDGSNLTGVNGTPGEHAPAAPVAATVSTNTPAAASLPHAADLPQRIATNYRTAGAILDAMRARGAGQRRANVPFVAPSGPVEMALAAIWKQVLGVTLVGAEDDFFELGGNSLLATQVASRVHTSFDVDLPLHSLFDAPTVATLATAVARRQDESPRALEDTAMALGSQDRDRDRQWQLTDLDLLSDEEVDAMLGTLQGDETVVVDEAVIAPRKDEGLREAQDPMTMIGPRDQDPRDQDQDMERRLAELGLLLDEEVDAMLGALLCRQGMTLMSEDTRVGQDLSAEQGGRPATGPLSFGQEQLWVIDQLAPGSPAYNIVEGLRLSGPLDVAALERALAAVVRRHEALRTTFRAATADGRPVQVIAPALAVPLRVVDLGALPAATREAAAQERAAEEARLPFDFGRGPLLRATLLRLDAGAHLLVLVVHHIVADGWSMGLLIRELAACYAAAVDGAEAPAELPVLPVQYADFARQQREWLRGENIADHLAYWTQQLGGMPDSLDLPADRPRPPVQTFRGAWYEFALPAELYAAIVRLSQKERVTPFMTLLAAFQALLHRYTGRDDIVVGSPVAGRTRTETEGLIGLFMGMLVLRGDLAGDPTFRELLGRARDLALDAYDHQDMPFEHLVEELRPARDPSRNPLFQVMFALQNMPAPPNNMAGVDLRREEIHTGTAKFDLSLILIPQTEDGGLRGLLEYNTDLFEEATIARMAEHFRTLLEGIAADPDRRLSALPLLTEVERRQLLVDWNSTVAPLPEATLPALVAAQAARTPDAVAVVCADEELTYAALEGRADRLARRLRELGVGPDVLVGLYTERSLAMVVGLLGILKAGGAYVPLDPSFPVERLAFMAADAALPVLVTQAALVGRLPAHAARVVLLDDPDPDPDAAAGDAGDAGGGATLDDLAYVLYTSGSTGHPKGVQIPHRALVNFLASMRRAPGLTAADTLLAVTTLSFDIAGLELYLPLIVGARLVVAGRDVAVDGAALAATLTRTGATVMQATPATWRLLLDAGWQGDPRLTALCGGEALPGELAARLRPRVGALWNMYGPTETTIWSTIQEVAEPVGAAGEVVPIGRPIANTQTYVLDGHMRPVPVGVPGELCIGGAGLARGYLGRPALTAERFVPDPFATAPGARLYKTGDRARYRPDGTLEYLGRLDNQVKVRGYRIELGEVEATLAAHPAVRQAVVTVREDTPGDARLVAYVVPEPGGAPAAEELRALLRERLPAYMVPSAFVALAAFPLTPNGKVDRRALPAPDAAQPADTDAGAYVAPRTPTEREVATVWAEVLKLARVGAEDDFFDIGGHSLLATQVVARLRAARGPGMSLRTLFDAPTVALLAAALDALPPRQADAGARFSAAPVARKLN